jgi:hypothetical protein
MWSPALPLAYVFVISAHFALRPDAIASVIGDPFRLRVSSTASCAQAHASRRAENLRAL